MIFELSIRTQRIPRFLCLKLDGFDYPQCDILRLEFKLQVYVLALVINTESRIVAREYEYPVANVHDLNSYI